MSTATGGSTSGGNASGGSALGSGGSVAPSSGGAATGSGGTSATSGGTASAGLGGSAGLSGGGSGNSGAAGMNGGSSGSSGSAGGGAAGSSGSAAGGSAGSSGSAGGGAGGATSGGGAGGGGMAGGSSGMDIACPADATFCSGFEGTMLPTGAKWHAVGPSGDNAYAFDSMQAAAGKQSFSIPMAGGGFYYRALAVPVPGQNFWVRLYVRLSGVFGNNSHDSLFGASSGNLDADVNNEALVEFSEQFDQVLLNTDDQVFTPDTKTTLEANKWYCMEAHYDGASGNVEIFADGKQIINATGYAKLNYQSFRIGYMQYNDARSIWYDDVIVAPSRVNCK